MQSEGKLAAGVAKKYPSAFAAYGIIVRCAPASVTSVFIDPYGTQWDAVGYRDQPYTATCNQIFPSCQAYRQLSTCCMVAATCRLLSSLQNPLAELV